MKIEMGESLFLSWLRHTKDCPIVQSNWKPSPAWQIQNEEEVKRLMLLSDEHFKSKYDYEIFKNNSLSQLLQQAEIDVLGVSLGGNKNMIYAIDVAYHEGGLNYGDKQETTIRVVKKIIRTAMCLRSYFNATKAEIVFASPKINPANLKLIEPTLPEVNKLFTKAGLDFSAEIIANEKFNELVLKPITLASNDVSDTSELFLRAYQLVKMFDADGYVHRSIQKKSTEEKTLNGEVRERKIGEIAQEELRNILETYKLSTLEIESMQTKEYSKRVFGINYPLLMHTDAERTERYYSKFLLRIEGNTYYLCSQWLEKYSRTLLMKWLGEHGRIADDCHA